MDRVNTGYWVAVVPTEEIHLIAALRRAREAEALPMEDRVWLRGPLWIGLTKDELEQRLLRLIPGIRPCLSSDDGQLTRLGDRVPSDRMPRGSWLPLSDWLRMELPPVSATFPGSVPVVALSLVRSVEEREPTLLLTSLSLWADYAATAAQWRLERLVFAMDSSQRVLIRGTPLPPLPGQRWVERSGVATPAGWTWTPAIAAVVLHDKFQLQREDLALLEHSHSQIVRETDWIRGTRSAVRSTVEAAHGT